VFESGTFWTGLDKPGQVLCPAFSLLLFNSYVSLLSLDSILRVGLLKTDSQFFEGAFGSPRAVDKDLAMRVWCYLLDGVHCPRRT
jgi:hypothetical protein